MFSQMSSVKVKFHPESGSHFQTEPKATEGRQQPCDQLLDLASTHLGAARVFLGSASGAWLFHPTLLSTLCTWARTSPCVPQFNPPQGGRTLAHPPHQGTL